MLRNHLSLQEGHWVEVVKRKPVVYLDLNLDEAVLWQGLCRGHKSSVNKARRQGVQVVRERITRDTLAGFQRLYMQTMQRHHASERWLFPENYFVNCATCLGEDRLSLFAAKLEDLIIAEYLIIHAYGTVYYHFGGSTEGHFYLRGNNLLMYEIALWAKAQGYRYFHLGGGYTTDDSLYRFKSGFSDLEAWFYTYSLIHDKERYKDLCAMRDAWEQTHGMTIRRDDFFPAYRRGERP